VDLLKTRENGRKQAEGLLQALAKDQNGIPKLMKAVLASDFETIETAAREFKIDPPVLTLLLRLALRPALLNVSQAVLEQLDLNQWSYGHCPVCGSAPKLADFSGEGGMRTLHCSLCETAWPYTRLRCPFCENDNMEDLSYLRAESEEGLRVDLCSHCGHYIKTIDLRELPGPIIVPLDDVATWHLDIIAQENLENREFDNRQG
jgi:FdhE protein